MTTGFVSLDAFSSAPGGSFYGSKGSRSWSGQDEPRAPSVKASFYYITRESVRHGKTVIRRIRIRMPGYTPKRAKHGYHNYSKSILLTKQTAIPSGMYGDGTPYPDMWLNGNIGSWTTSSLLDANDQIKLVNKLSEKLQGSDFNVSVFLGEGHQTLKMLADSAIRIRKAYVHAKRLDVFGAARSLFEGTSRKPLAKHDWTKHRPGSGSAKNAANLWLELQYGWLPLLNDAEACAQSLAHALNVPFRQSYRTSVRKEVNRVATTPSFGPTTPQLDNLCSQSHRRSLIAYISEPPSALAQLGLLDPELVAWELLPFSFVADWFIPIGSYLEARAKASRLTGTFITTDKVVSFVGPMKIGGVQYTSSTYFQLLFNRVVSSALKVPLPNFKPLEKVASWRHCANAVALLVQMGSGGSNPLPVSHPTSKPPFNWGHGFHP